MIRLIPPAPSLCALALAALLGTHAAAAQQVTDRVRLAQTGMKFLNVAADPRAAALGGAVTSLEGGAEMLFTNPAGMAWMQEGTSAVVSQTSWIADINHNHAGVALRPARGRYGVFGVSLNVVDYGEMQETIFADTEQGYVDVGTFQPTALAIGVGYARALSDRFSAGGHVKYASQNFGSPVLRRGADGELERGSAQAGVLAYDFGVHYKTPFRSLTFAVGARNFASEVTLAEESFQLPITLNIGVSMNVVDLTSLDPSMHRLLVSADAANNRDYPEQLRLGGEYTFMNTFALRGGYAFPSDEEGVTLGAGLRQRLGGVGFGADYAYTDFGVFSAVHRIAVRFSL
ncbi:MAG: PorV/PorQ family protein [Rubricoccaceae bacterium]